MLDDYRAEFSPSVMMKMMKMMMQKQPESRSNDVKLENEAFVFMFILNLSDVTLTYFSHRGLFLAIMKIFWTFVSDHQD